MSTSSTTVEYILEQTAGAGHMRARKMFGEYGLYCNETIVGLICDDQLFIKPTPAGRLFLEKPIEKSAYPGSKPYFWISGEQWEDAAWLSSLILQTEHWLSAVKKK